MEQWMREVVVSNYVTLDGVFQEPAWSAPYWSDEAQHFARDQLWASDALLLGRKTFEGFAQHWQTDEWIEREGEFAERMNRYPKYVASTILEEPLEWNNSHVLGEDVVGEIGKLKEEDGKNLLMYGSRTLVHTLIDEDVVDRFLIWVHPLILGEGERLFPNGVRKTELELVDATTLENGIVVLDLRRAGA
jgi:dihydrofolate reductase